MAGEQGGYKPGDWVTMVACIKPPYPHDPPIGAVGQVQEPHSWGWLVSWVGGHTCGMVPRQIRLATPDEIAQACMASPEGEL